MLNHSITTYSPHKVHTLSLARPIYETLLAAQTAAGIMSVAPDAFAVAAHVRCGADGSREANTYQVYLRCGSTQYHVMWIDGHPTSGMVTRYSESEWPRYREQHQQFLAWDRDRPARIKARTDRLFAAAAAKADRLADKIQLELDSRTAADWTLALDLANKEIDRANAEQDERAERLRRRIDRGDNHAAAALPTCVHQPHYTPEAFRAAEYGRVTAARNDRGVLSEIIEMAETETESNFTPQEVTHA